MKANIIMNIHINIEMKICVHKDEYELRIEHVQENLFSICMYINRKITTDMHTHMDTYTNTDTETSTEMSMSLNINK